jgi:two-component system response regulator PilR (NtrC family)
MDHNLFSDILLVEDDDVLRAGLRDFLLEQGVSAICSRDGEEALRAIDEARNPFDVVLTDLVMPHKDGLDVLRMAKQRSPQTEVIIMTGFASLETAIDAMRQGAFDYITKPFQFVEIELVLTRIAERKKLIDENIRLSESIQSLHSRLELLKDSRSKLDRFIAETSEKLDRQSQQIMDCTEMIKKLSSQFEANHRPPK